MKKIKIIAIFLMLILTSCANKNIIDNFDSRDIDIISRNLTHLRGATNVTYNTKGTYEARLIDNMSLIYYTDFEKLISVPLCTNAECEHNDETCTAYLNDSAPFLFMNAKGDKLFTIIREPNKDNTYVERIYSMELDGSKRELIYEFKQNENMDSSKHIVGIGDKIYFSISIYTDENEVTLRNTYKILELNYITKEVKDIVESENCISLQDVLDGEIIYYEAYMLENIIRHKSIRIDTGTISEIAESMYAAYADGEYYSKNTQIYNGFIYTSTRKNGSKECVLTITDLALGQEKKFITKKDNESEYGTGPGIIDVFDNIVILYDYSIENGEKMKLLNTETGKIKDFYLKVENEPRNYYIGISAVCEDKFFVANSVETKEYVYKGKQGEDIPGQISVYKNSFITKEDFYNSIPNYISLE